jgi:hypothetical protein
VTVGLVRARCADCGHDRAVAFPDEGRGFCPSCHLKVWRTGASESSWAAHLCHPLPLSTLVLLVANDHCLKHIPALPGWLTGKLSDFAGLFLFPTVCVALVAVWRPLAEPARRRLARAIVLGTGALFCALKLYPAPRAPIPAALGVIVCDPTDLAALPALVGAWFWLRRPRRERKRRSDRVQRAVLAIAALACVATSPPLYVRNYPAWQGPALAGRLGCIERRVWVAKSGKEGLGVVVLFQNRGATSCVAAVDEAQFRIGDQLTG